MKKTTKNEPTLSDLLERTGMEFDDLCDFFTKSGVKESEPAKPEWEDLTVTWTLNKEQAIELWHRLSVRLFNIEWQEECTKQDPTDCNLSVIWEDIDNHLENMGELI